MEDNELCQINPFKGHFLVTVWSANGQKEASFYCDNEADARALRDAIRAHAVRLQSVFKA